MADALIEDHLLRLRTATIQRHTAAGIADYISKYTTLAGLPYSYKDHEYQQKILSDVSRHVVIRKCSQIGLSEASARMALALVNILRRYTVAYTLPTATFAGTFAKTRIDPVIEGSRVMKAAVHRTNNNNEVKQFGESLLFLRGAASSNASISIPCDHLIHDEVDFSDQEILTQYLSRLTHSPWKRIHKLSTPTVPGFGISLAFDESRRHFNMLKCNHCNHQYIPDYYAHVVIPGFTGNLREINKQTLTRIRWKEAYVKCPKCQGRPSLQSEHREWVCENPDDDHVAAGYQVTPFDAPNLISAADLVETSAGYERRQDFDNFSLGLPVEDTEATLTRQDLVGLFNTDEVSPNCVHVMGVDVGNLYHFMVGAVGPMGDIKVVYREQVPMGKAKERYHQLRAQWRVVCTVIDSAPHAETVMSLQASDVNCFASVYVNNKSITTHTIVDKDAEAKVGESFVRQVNVNRSRAFDAYMAAIRERNVMFAAGDDAELVMAHHMSMKRVKIYENESGEMKYAWQKSDGQDHYHHAALYMWVAARIKGVGRNLIQLPTSSILTLRLKPR